MAEPVTLTIDHIAGGLPASKLLSLPAAQARARFRMVRPALLRAATLKPFSQACENNKQPILEILRDLLADAETVLEIGSGTGQHAAFFAAELPHLRWQTSDLSANHAGILAWIDDAANALAPLALDVDARVWPLEEVDAVFSANTAHIMHWPSVENMFRGVSRVLRCGGHFALYGPFNYGGRYTSPSNERFDRTLRAQDPGMGIRDFEALDALARRLDLELVADHAMPANNRTLVWQRRAATGAHE